MNLVEETSESVAWQNERNAEAREYLRSLPAFEPLRKALLGWVGESRLSAQTRAGDRWFGNTVVDPAADLPVFAVRSAPTGEPRVLIDPNEIAAKRGVPVMLNYAAPSPDGTKVVYAIAPAGTEQTEVGVIDVDTGEHLPDAIPWNMQFPPAWLPDSSGFWCSRMEIVDGAYTIKIAKVVLGEPLPTDTLPLPEGLSFPAPVLSRDGRHLAIRTGNTEPRLDYIVSGGQVTPFLLGVEGGVSGQFHGDDLYAMTERDAPRGRIVRIPVATASDTSTWTTLVPESDDVIRTVDVVAGRIVCGYLRDATSRLRIYELDGTLVEDIDLPGDGCVSIAPFGAAHPSMPMFMTGGEEISFLHSTPATSVALYRYLVADAKLEVVRPSETTIDGLVVRLVEAPSKDGTLVPAHVIHRADLDPSATHPALVHGYGGFNLAWLPAFLGEYAAWVQAGGIYVLPHLRGGSDFGAEWWQGGRRERKQNTFDDHYAVAEHLIELGLTTREQLACTGESNGGLLTAAAAAQRPDLYAAIVVQVPICDVLGMGRDPVTYAIGRDEYGDPLDEGEAGWMAEFSPLQNVKPGAEYPATLIIAGANDPRCPAWHARAMTGALRDAQAGDEPILLRVHADQGHGASGVSAQAAQAAEWMALCADRTGLKV